MPIVVPQENTPQVGGIPQARLPSVGAGPVPDSGASTAAGVSSAMNELGGKADQYINEQARMANETALTGLDLEASHEQTRIELAARNMRGQDALKAPDFVADQWNQVQERLKKKTANQSQQQALQRLLGQRSENLDKVVQTHSADELVKFDAAQSDANLAAYSDEAVNNYKDPDRIAEARGKQDAVIDMTAQRQGWSPEIVAQKKLDAGSLTNTAVVMRMLDNGDYKSANEYYQGNKDQFAGKDILTVEKNLEEGKVRSMGLSAWSEVQGLKLSDGTPDEAAQEKAILNRSDLTDSEKEKVVSYVKQRATTDYVNKSKQDRANDRTFLNSAIQARQKGVSLEAALPMARKFGSDTYDQSLKEQALRQIYAPAEVKTDPPTKVALLDGIDAGTVDKAQIDRAYEQKLISPNDWMQAREIYRKNIIDGHNPQQQRTNEQLKLIAKTQFGADQEGANSWLSEIKSQGFGKTPEEQIKLATDSIKQDQSSVSRFWNFLPVVGGEPIPGTGTPQFQTDIQKRTNESLLKGQLQSDLGAETVKAIDIGNARTGSAQGTTQTIQDLSVAAGGYENLKPGKPFYNAMQSLIRANKVVTSDAVKAVLTHYPDGNFTVNSTPATANQVGKIPRVRTR